MNRDTGTVADPILTPCSCISVLLSARFRESMSTAVAVDMVRVNASELYVYCVRWRTFESWANVSPYSSISACTSGAISMSDLYRMPIANRPSTGRGHPSRQRSSVRQR